MRQLTKTNHHLLLHGLGSPRSQAALKFTLGIAIKRCTGLRRRGVMLALSAMPEVARLATGDGVFVRVGPWGAEQGSKVACCADSQPLSSEPWDLRIGTARMLAVRSSRGDTRGDLSLLLFPSVDPTRSSHYIRIEDRPPVEGPSTVEMHWGSSSGPWHDLTGGCEGMATDAALAGRLSSQSSPQLGSFGSASQALSCRAATNQHGAERRRL